MKKLVSVLMVLALLLTGLSAVAEGIDVDTLRIQFVPTNTETADAATADFSAYMSNLLGIPVTVTVATSYNGIVEAMESGTVDVGIMPPRHLRAGPRDGRRFRHPVLHSGRL